MPRYLRCLLVGASIVGAVLGAIELLARENVRRERARRASPGNLLHLEEQGAGDPLVLLAGFQGSTRYWSPVVGELSARRRVVRVDALGFGRSPWPDTAYSLDDHLAALDRTLEHAGVNEHVTLVGHSVGAILASYAATRRPERIDRLVLLGAPVFDSADEGRRRIEEMSSLASFFALSPVIARESCQLVCAFRPLFGRLATRARGDLPREVAEDAVLHDWQSFRGTMDHVVLGAPIRQALRDLAKHRSIDIVFLHGDQDAVTPLPSVQSLAAEIRAAVATCSGTHHQYLDRCRDELVSVLEIGR